MSMISMLIIKLSVVKLSTVYVVTYVHMMLYDMS